LEAENAKALARGRGRTTAARPISLKPSRPPACRAGACSGRRAKADTLSDLARRPICRDPRGGFCFTLQRAGFVASDGKLSVKPAARLLDVRTYSRLSNHVVVGAAAGVDNCLQMRRAKSVRWPILTVTMRIQLSAPADAGCFRRHLYRVKVPPYAHRFGPRLAVGRLRR